MWNVFKIRIIFRIHLEMMDRKVFGKLKGGSRANCVHNVQCRASLERHQTWCVPRCPVASHAVAVFS